MLTIFDLDDTLVDTTRCLTVQHQRQAFAKMAEAGLGPYDFNAFAKINETALSSSAALEEFGVKAGIASHLIDIGVRVLKGMFEGEFEIDPVPGALELLEFLKENHTLALVTIGNEEFQRAKLEKAGIQPSLFGKIVVGGGPSKKALYRELLEEMEWPAEDALVCGDRVSIDLTPAKELGMTTVHLPNGRGKVHNTPESDVDFTLRNLKALTRVIDEIKSPSNQ